MNILSVIVPSYNSETFLSKCIETLTAGGEEVEIIIVNDGSTDKTGELADQFQAAYSNIKAVHQANAGHGGAVNTGIAMATGRYIKVVDSDDWVNPVVLHKIVQQLKLFIENEDRVDMVISNFIYDKKDAPNKKIMHYRGLIPQDKIVDWNEIKRFRANQYILMHSVIYSREVLRNSGLMLPKHTFYVDNLFVYMPLPYVDRIYYIDECLYHYFIGRDEQSVNEANMMKRIDQQLLVNKTMLEGVDLAEIEDRSKRRYMTHYLNIVTTVSSIILFKIGTEEAMQEKKALWRAIRDNDVYLFYRMRNSLIGSIINFPGRMGRKLSLYIYSKARQRVGFN